MARHGVPPRSPAPRHPRCALGLLAPLLLSSLLALARPSAAAVRQVSSAAAAEEGRVEAGSGALALSVTSAGAAALQEPGQGHGHRHRHGQAAGVPPPPGRHKRRRHHAPPVWRRPPAWLEEGRTMKPPHHHRHLRRPPPRQHKHHRKPPPRHHEHHHRKPPPPHHKHHHRKSPPSLHKHHLREPPPQVQSLGPPDGAPPSSPSPTAQGTPGSSGNGGNAEATQAAALSALVAAGFTTAASALESSGLLLALPEAGATLLAPSDAAFAWGRLPWSIVLLLADAAKGPRVSRNLMAHHLLTEYSTFEGFAPGVFTTLLNGSQVQSLVSRRGLAFDSVPAGGHRARVVVRSIYAEEGVLSILGVNSVLTVPQSLLLLPVDTPSPPPAEAPPPLPGLVPPPAPAPAPAPAPGPGPDLALPEPVPAPLMETPAPAPAPTSVGPVPHHSPVAPSSPVLPPASLPPSPPSGPVAPAPGIGSPPEGPAPMAPTMNLPSVVVPPIPPQGPEAPPPDAPAPPQSAAPPMGPVAPTENLPPVVVSPIAPQGPVAPTPVAPALPQRTAPPAAPATPVPNPAPGPVPIAPVPATPSIPSVLPPCPSHLPVPAPQSSVPAPATAPVALAPEGPLPSDEFVQYLMDTGLTMSAAWLQQTSTGLTLMDDTRTFPSFVLFVPTNEAWASIQPPAAAKLVASSVYANDSLMLLHTMAYASDFDLTHYNYTYNTSLANSMSQPVPLANTVLSNGTVLFAPQNTPAPPPMARNLTRLFVGRFPGSLQSAYSIDKVLIPSLELLLEPAPIPTPEFLPPLPAPAPVPFSPLVETMPPPPVVLDCIPLRSSVAPT